MDFNQIFYESNSIHDPAYKVSDGDISCIMNVFEFPKYENFEWDSRDDRKYAGGTLAHNTSIQNLSKIIRQGIRYDAEGQYHSNSFIWGVNIKVFNEITSRHENSGYMESPRGYGGTTIIFDPSRYVVEKLNDDEFAVYDNVSVNDILAIDVQMGNSSTYTYGKLSDMPQLIKEYGLDKVKEVMIGHHTSELSDEQVEKLIDWANEQI